MMADRTYRDARRAGRTVDGPSRRHVLTALGSGIAGLLGAKAVDNAVLGYGRLTGTNLLEQPLDGLAGAELRPTPFSVVLAGTTVTYDGARIRLGADGGSVSVPATDIDQVRAIEHEHGLAGDPLAQLATDLAAVADDAVRFAFVDRASFIDRLGASATRPITVAALRGRGFRRPSPEIVRSFAGTDPANTAALVAGLAAGFRSHTHYDTGRYLRRSIQRNLLFDRVSLDRPSATDYGTIAGEGRTPMLCWDYAYRSIEAFHVVPPHRQTLPVMGAVITDRRHGHVYTGLASVVRDGNGLEIPMTFLDYRDAILRDDRRAGLRTGDEVNAYDTRHRATRISWDR